MSPQNKKNPETKFQKELTTELHERDASKGFVIRKHHRDASKERIVRMHHRDASQ